MAMTREGYATEYNAKTSEKVAITTGGNLALSGDPIIGEKRITIKGVNVDNDLEKNHSVFGLFHAIVGVYTTETTNRMTITLEAL